jgi:endogenous inhibitor of DNA gyrase (YacG/DUF329 family)
MGVIEELKSIGKVLQEAGKIEQYRQILDAQQKLLEMQSRISELEIDNRSLRDKLAKKDDFVYDKTRSSYWTENGDGPFCSRCWDVEKNTVRLKPYNNLAFHSCPECNTTVQTDPGYNPHRSKVSPPSFR